MYGLIKLYSGCENKIKIGVSASAIIKLHNAPTVIRTTASKPRPSSNSLWPGRIEAAVLGSGAPRKIEGIVEMNAFVIAIETMNKDRESGEK